MLPSRGRGEAAAWGVLPVVVVVIVVGGLFWASVWMAFSSSIASVTVRSSDLVDEAVESEYEDVDPDQAVADAAYGPALTDEEAVEGPYAELDEATDAPATGASAFVGPVEELDELAAIALGNAAATGTMASSGEAAIKDEILTIRAEELTARAEALTARNEELVVKLDGLTTKIEELEAKLEASGAVIASLPAVVPSPVALPRPSDPATVRTSQTQSGRSPWVVSPLPEPASRVTAGPVVLETRARGEAPIKEIRLQLDGVPVAVALERQNETTWRGRASARVAAGSHTVSVSVVDGQGRVGSYRWKFEATPS